ncbi:MAG: extracellular solute-binding protein [Succinatimonas sp.]|nr:extracellular solute-binding protein [Succinatimonas sp.]
MLKTVYFDAHHRHKWQCFRIRLVDKGWENINTLFEQGKIAAVINNTGKFIDYAKAGVNYGIAPLPVNLDGKPLTPFYSTYNYAIPTRSNQKEMAQKFLAYLNVPMTTYERYLHTAELPTINDVLNSNLVSNDDFANAIFTQMHTSKQISYDKFMDFIWDPMNDALKKITIDGAEPSKTLDEAVDNMF